MAVDLPTDSDGEVSLPSLDDDGPGQLTESDAVAVTNWHCGCKFLCVPHHSDLEIGCNALREMLGRCDRDERRKRVWLSLRDMRVVKGMPNSQYEILGSPVCRKIWQKAHLCGSSTLKQLQGAVLADGPPPDGRQKGLHCRTAGLAAGQEDVSKFFYHAWSNWAMHVPTENGAGFEIEAPACAAPLDCVAGGAEGGGDSQVSDKMPDCLAEPVLGPDACKVDSRRYLPHQSWQEFYEMYVSWSENPVHKTTFRRHYRNSDWSDKLRIADASEHNKCTTCEKPKSLRKKAACEDHVRQIQNAHSSHVKAVMLDRNMDTSCEQLGSDSVQINATLPREQALLNWTQDGMDQAKFRVPRNTSMAKALSDAWRPQVQANGLIMDGVGKFLFLMDQDIGKSSDLQCTVTTRALEA